MELIAKDNHGDIWEVYAYDRLFVWATRHGENQCFEFVYDSPIRGQATLHVSTCTFDKNEREILVGDVVQTGDSHVHFIWYTGKDFIAIGSTRPQQLTPELAETMEVVS